MRLDSKILYKKGKENLNNKAKFMFRFEKKIQKRK